MKFFLLILTLLLFLSPIILAGTPYVDPLDPRANDQTRFIDPNDSRFNSLENQKFLDPLDPREYLSLRTLNFVKSFQGNIDFYSSNNSVSIVPDLFNSRINFTTTISSGGGSDSNKVGISATDTVPDYLASSLIAGNRIALTTFFLGSNEFLRIDANVDTNPMQFTGDILGTTNQVSVSNGVDRLFGSSDVTLSLPQNIDGSASPQFVGLTLSPCSTFQVDASPQLRFKVDCAGNLVTSTNIIPVQAGTSDIGNSSNVWDDLWVNDINARNDINGTNLSIKGNAKIVNLSVDDLNASCDDLNDNCLTEIDGNALYIKNYSNSVQIISGTATNALDVNGSIRPLLQNTSSLGANGRRFFQGFINQIFAVPGAGMGALNFPANSSAFCATGTDSCLDYNGTARVIGITDANIFHHFWGTTATASGITYRIPVSSAPALGSGLPMFENAEYDHNYGSTYGALYQPMKYRNSVWAHVDSISFYGTPNDGIFDQNRIGDINGVGDLNITKGNLSLDDGNFLSGAHWSLFSVVGTTCNSLCSSIVVDGPWACVEARTTAGGASTCAQNLVAVNCLCKN